MSNTVRNGFSTLNRLLGKKNKDSSVSKSTTNLSTLDTSSQHNKIIPLAASTNAPFEQTFRITICLPRDQLFVVRVGAKTKLKNLLEMVCTNKQLDKDKFEFRHPDGTHAYSNELTIGEVGLNEIRLTEKGSKIEATIKSSSKEMTRLPQNIRESLITNSELSKTSSKQYLKSTSPYSSTNSLNSLDSASMTFASNHSRMQYAPVAPIRKKRAAPRPPSQNSIPENQENADANIFKKPLPLAMPRKNFHVSSPNLYNVISNNTKEDERYLNNNNNNNNINAVNIDNNNINYNNGGISAITLPHENRSSTNDINQTPPARPMSTSFLRNKPAQQNDLHRSTYAAVSTPHLNHSRTSSDSSVIKDGAPEPTPRKRIASALLKKKAAPAPPPRAVHRNASDLVKDKITSEVISSAQPLPIVEVPNTNVQTKSNISKIMLNVDDSSAEHAPETETTKDLQSADVLVDSKVIVAPVDDVEHTDALNKSQIYEENQMDSSDEEETKVYNIQMGKPISSIATAENAAPKAVVRPLHSHTENVEIVENVKNEYKEVTDKITLDQLQQQQILVANTTSNDSSMQATKKSNIDHLKESSQPSSRAESPLWTYTLPAPLKFADHESDTLSDVNANVSEKPESSSIKIIDEPIKPLINERIPVNFDMFTDTSIVSDEHSMITSDMEDGYQGYSQKFSREALLDNLDKHRSKFIESEFKFLNNIDSSIEPCEQSDISEVDSSTPQILIESSKANVIDELNQVLTNKVDSTTIVKQSHENEPTIIEGVKHNVLSNFTIQTYEPNRNAEELSIYQSPHSRIQSTDENTSCPPTKRTSIPDTVNAYAVLKTPNRINRSDSFHSTRNDFPDNFNGLTPRSSSYISLIGTQKFETRSMKSNLHFDGTNRRKSSSELSIADSPSLQSLTVLKSILSNSRKDNLNNETKRASLSEINLNENELRPRRLSAQFNIVVNNNSIPNEGKAGFREIFIPSSQILADDIKDNTNIRTNISQVTIELKNNTAHEEVSKSNVVQIEETSRVNHSEGQSKHSIDTNETHNTKDQHNTTHAHNNLNSPEISKKWEYKGPPAINLSTWNERPKSTIQIKSDLDYKFGGSNQSKYISTISSVQVDPVGISQSQNAKNDQATDASSPIEAVIEKPSNRPISTHSDADHLPIVRGFVKKTVSPTQELVNPLLSAGVQLRRPSYEIVTVKSNNAIRNSDIGMFSVKTLDRVPMKYTSVNSFNMQRGSSFTSATINNNTSKYSGVTVKGFKISPSSGEVANTNKDIVNDGSFDSGYKSMPSQYTESTLLSQPAQKVNAENEAPFSQLTLRRTGFKEKMLADSVSSSAPSTPEAAIISHVQPIQMKQQGTNSIYMRAHSAPIQQTNTLSVPPPPPPLVNIPKPIPVMRSVSTKKNIQPIQVDPHDTLLESIRNFSKDKLKKK